MRIGIKKQILYGGAFLFIVALFLFLIISAIIPNPTCFDGKQNQKEEGVDCGGPCQACKPPVKDLKIGWTKYFKIKEGVFDAVVNIKNPNLIYGASKIDYEFIFFEKTGKELTRKSGRSFIIPLDSRYIIESAIPIKGEPTRIKFEIKNIEWTEVNENLRNINLSVINKSYKYEDKDFIFAKAQGSLVNNSDFGFNSVEIVAVLEDESGNILSINKTVLDSVLSRESRPFEILWFQPFGGTVANIIIEAKTNIMLKENFLGPVAEF